MVFAAIDTRKTLAKLEEAGCDNKLANAVHHGYCFGC